LAKEFAGGVVGEAEISSEELLIQDGCAEEVAHLLFFDGIAREGQGVAAASEDDTGDLAVQRGEECQRTLVEGKNGIAAAEFDAIGGGDVIDGCRVDAQSIQRIVQFVGCSFGGRGNRRRQKTPQRDELRPNPHVGSVVTFGMEEQGGREQSPA